MEAELPSDLQGNATTYQPLNTLGSRVINQHGESVQQVLVQWQGKAPEGATWEDSSIIKISLQTSTLTTMLFRRREVLLGIKLNHQQRPGELYNSI